MGERQTTDLVVNALVMALARRAPDGELIHHADHGSQYTSLEFTNRLERLEDQRVLRQRRRLLRQRRDGIDLGDDQEGDPPHLGPVGAAHPLAAAHDPVRIHRSVLQPPTPPSPARAPHPGRGLRSRRSRVTHNNPCPRSRVNSTGYKKRIERFISWLPPGVPVLWDNIPAMSPAFDPTLDQNYQIVNRALGRAAAETPNLYIVDLRTPFAGHWPDWYQSDQLHYNDTGQYEFALVNCQELNTVSAALDPQPIGVDAPCDPNYGSTTTVASVRDTR